MELIPILSLIILVATISTFILAVGAYILYKIRERKGRNVFVEPPQSIQAELVTPTRVVAETSSIRRTATGEKIYTRETSNDNHEKSMRPTFVAPHETRSTRVNATKYTSPVTRETFEGERYTTSQKFKRYGSDSAKTKEIKKEENLKWR